MNYLKWLKVAEKIVEGREPDDETHRDLAAVPDEDVFQMLPGADLLRQDRFGREIHLCSIQNGKSGRCSEDCAFCAQSVHVKTDAPIYPLMSGESLIRAGLEAVRTPMNRFSIVTAGRGLPAEEVKSTAAALAELKGYPVQTCASLGIIGPADFAVLRAAGVSRYHHNLETAASHFPDICTTHTYRQRIETIEAAQEAGLSVCVGGIFGLGESMAQILEFASTLKQLRVDAVPVNFLTPVKGTRLENRKQLSPLKCLKIIALLRYLLPDREIIVCGGREANLRELHPLIFQAGASGLMTRNYLTTKGRSLEDDLDMIANLGYSIRKK